jgi:predicted N-acetyltransferase YhbS
MTLIEPVAPGDWPQIENIERSAYEQSGLSEGREALQSRAAPGTSFVARAGDRVVGYLLALPYPRFSAPSLDRPGSFTAGPDLHLHDCVIDASFRRQGLASRLHAQLLAAAVAFDHVSLIAVGGSDTFWAAHGYRRHPRVPVPPSYGKQAIYMSRGVHHGR